MQQGTTWPGPMKHGCSTMLRRALSTVDEGDSLDHGATRVTPAIYLSSPSSFPKDGPPHAHASSRALGPSAVGKAPLSETKTSTGTKFFHLLRHALRSRNSDRNNRPCPTAEPHSAAAKGSGCARLPPKLVAAPSSASSAHVLGRSSSSGPNSAAPSTLSPKATGVRPASAGSSTASWAHRASWPCPAELANAYPAYPHHARASASTYGSTAVRASHAPAPNLVQTMPDADVHNATGALQLGCRIHDSVWGGAGGGGGSSGGGSSSAEREALVAAAGALYAEAVAANERIQHRALRSLVEQALQRYVNPGHGNPDDVLRVILELLHSTSGPARGARAPAAGPPCASPPCASPLGSPPAGGHPLASLGRENSWQGGSECGSTWSEGCSSSNSSSVNHCASSGLSSCSSFRCLTGVAAAPSGGPGGRGCTSVTGFSDL